MAVLDVFAVFAVFAVFTVCVVLAVFDVFAVFAVFAAFAVLAVFAGFDVRLHPLLPELLITARHGHSDRKEVLAGPNRLSKPLSPPP